MPICHVKRCILSRLNKLQQWWLKQITRMGSYWIFCWLILHNSSSLSGYVHLRNYICTFIKLTTKHEAGQMISCSITSPALMFKSIISLQLKISEDFRRVEPIAIELLSAFDHAVLTWVFASMQAPLASRGWALHQIVTPESTVSKIAYTRSNSGCSLILETGIRKPFKGTRISPNLPDPNTHLDCFW